MKWQVAEEQNEVKAQGCTMRNSMRRKQIPQWGGGVQGPLT